MRSRDRCDESPIRIKVTYLTSSLEGSSPGVRSKVIRQVQGLRGCEMDAELMEYRLNIVGIIRANLRLRRSLGDDGILYCRFPTPFMFLTPFIIPSIRNRPMMLELNSIYEREFEAEGRNLIIRFISRYIAPRYLKLIDGGVAVTDEIRDHYLRYQSSIATIGNGFDVDSVPLKRRPDSGREIIMVANLSRWHGIERLVEGVALMDRDRELLVHIVGSGREEGRIASLIEERGLGDRILMHGPKTGMELDELFDRSSLAIGSLGLHRMGLTQASTLKAREYCARGIPMVSTVDDPDLPPGLPFVLRVPSDESPLDMDSLLSFMDGQEPDVGERMRRHAEERMDWQVKASQLAAYIREKAER